MKTLRAVTSNRELALVEVVWAWVSLVRWALAILVALYAYGEAGATGVGVSALVRMLPAAVLAPRLSILADQRSRRLVLLWSLLARAGLAIVMVALVWVDASLVALLVAAAGYGIADSLQRPVQAALLGLHARNPTQLAAANTLWSILDNAGFVAGSMLVGVVVGVAGLDYAFLACVPPLLFAMVTTARLTPDAPLAPLEDTNRREESRAGVKAIVADGQLRLLVGILAADMFVQAMVDVLVVVAALDLLDMGQQGAGWLSTAWGVGGVVGGAVAIMMLARRHLASGLTVGLLLGGLPLSAIGLWPDQALALALMGLLGIGFGIVEVALLTLTQRLVAADVLGRVYGIQETVTIAAMAVGSVAAAGLVIVADADGALVLAGAVLPVLAVVLLRGVRRLDGGAAAPEGVFEILRSVSVFSTLPMGTVETLARQARREQFEAERDVVRQGQPGSTFYVIADGCVRVTENGEFRRLEVSGDFFGEIALLHRIPRTATVRTVEPTTVLVLGQEGFLAAVGAHPRTRHVLHDVMYGRLAPPDADQP